MQAGYQPPAPTTSQEDEVNRPLLSGEQQVSTNLADQHAEGAQSHHVQAPPHAQQAAPSQLLAQPPPQQQWQMDIPHLPYMQGAAASSVHPADTVAMHELLSAALQMPSIRERWAMMRPLLVAWLLSSCVNLLVFAASDGSTTAFILAELAAVLGILGPLIVTIPSCRGNVDMMTLTKQLHALGISALVLDVITLVITDAALLFVIMDCPTAEAEVCGMAKVVGFVFTVLLAGHAALSYQTSKAAQNFLQHLNPITSGTLSLD